MVWPFGRKCPHCESRNTTIDRGNNSLVCNNCGKVSELTETFFDKAKNRFKRKKEVSEPKKETEGENERKSGEEKPNKSHALRNFLLLALGILIVFYLIVPVFGSTPLGQDIVRQLHINDFTNWVSYEGCYVPCVANPSRWAQTTTQGLGDVGTYCDKVVCGVAQVKKEGCQEDQCLNFDLETFRPTPIVGSDETIRFTIKMDSQAPPAQNLEVKLDSKDIAASDITYEGNKCASETKCTFDSLSKEEAPIAIKAHFTVPCLDTIRYNGIVSYDYETIGRAPVYVKQENAQTPQNVEPITTSGPLNFNIEPDQHEYVAGSDKIIGVNIALQNKGDGDIAIDEIDLKQSYPNDFGPLESPKCSGANIQVDGNNIKITSLGKGYAISSRDIYKIDCTYKIPSGFSGWKIGQSGPEFRQYILEGNAKYTYTLNQLGKSIFVDTKSCEGSTSSTTTT